MKKRQKNSIVGRRSAGRANFKPADDAAAFRRDAYRDVERACINFFKSRDMRHGGFADYAVTFGKQKAASLQSAS